MNCRNSSYDEILRLYDVDTTLTLEGSPPTLTPLTSISLGGAVWRTMFFNLKDQLTLAVACGRDGIKLLHVDLSNNIPTLNEIHSYQKYKNYLCYGLDVSTSTSTTTIANCYFDNHVIHVWTLI
jgi:hypothetical protein